jgi:hypothetical protein
VAVALGVLVAFRIALAIAVLARAGHPVLPGFPVYRYDPTGGDTYAYYYGARELVKTWQRQATIVLPLALVGVALALLLVRRSRGVRDRGVVLVLGLAWIVGGLAAVLAGLSRFSGAPSIGWPLVWSVPMLPYRALRLSLDPNVAYGIGFAYWTIFIAAALVATYALGLALSARRGVALLGAALYAFWPLVALVIGGHRGTEKGTWAIDAGLGRVSEPLSTALVLTALALLVAAAYTPRNAALAGALLGFATAVRLSNAVIAAAVVVWLLLTHQRTRAALVAVAGCAFVPVVAAYWSKGYVALPADTFSPHPFALHYASRAWSDSLLWHPSVLLTLVPIALVGSLAAWSREAALLCACVAANAIFYTFYYDTPLHPRFMFVVLPIVLVLWAAGATAALSVRRLALAR